MKRLIWADSLKGILIILVILGHAIQAKLGSDCFDNHFWNYIYSFHMAAFMAVSGWLSYRVVNQFVKPLGGGVCLADYQQFTAEHNNYFSLSYYGRYLNV